MTYYVRYAVADTKPVTLSEIENGLRQVNLGYAIDADFLVLDDEEYGQIEILLSNHKLFPSELELIKLFAAQKENKEFLLSVLQKTTSLIVVQAIWSKNRSETLAVIGKMFEWLMHNRAGLVMDEDGTFYRDVAKSITSRHPGVAFIANMWHNGGQMR